MNWGYKLMLVFLVFAGFMATLVYKCMKSPASLVSAEYYKDELKYQQVIDGSARAEKLSTPIYVEINDGMVLLKLPSEMKKQALTGHVWFYCVANGNNDRKGQLSINEDGEQHFALSLFNAGRYVVKVDWEYSGNKYYSEKEIIVP